MLFNSFAYLIFLPLVVLLFWITPQRFRVALLLVASYIFYMSWNPTYGLLILGLTAINYFLGLVIHRSHAHKKSMMIVAVAANLVILGIFKYAYFTRDVINQALQPLGGAMPSIPLQIILPLGISFFVFEFIHYVVEVYKGGEPVRSFPAFALFASFFPTQIAGPIKRYQDFIPQLKLAGKFDLSNFDEGIGLILFGLFKKVLFADNLGVVVQSGFDHFQLLTTIDMWMVVYAFAFQIYFDFSGYTDIARGSALLFGYKVPVNFNLPYLASSIPDYWKRWHMSLTSWLRDYLFIPLGGSRCSNLLCYRNIIITMVLCGLWHGAAAHFVVFGFYQGIFMVLHREWRRLTGAFAWWQQAMATKIAHAASILLTFHVTCVGYVIFRADTVAAGLAIIRKLFFFDQVPAQQWWSVSLPAVNDPLIFMLLPLILALLFAGQIVCSRIAAWQRPIRVPTPLKAVYVAVLISLLMVFYPDTSPRFYYFQF